MKNFLVKAQTLLNKTRVVDFIAPLAFRIYLFPIFWMAGTNKLAHIDSTIAWFGNPDWGLGLPFPAFMAYAASSIEVIGAVLLLIGLATRWISIPLMLVMFVAIFSVHWENGWFAIAPEHYDSAMRLESFLDWIKENFPQRHEYIKELGSPVVLNNGVEFAVTYFLMLLSLFFTGAGKYLSVDYWLKRQFMPKN